MSQLHAEVRHGAITLHNTEGTQVRVSALVNNTKDCQWLAALYNRFHRCYKCGAICDRRDPACRECQIELDQLSEEHSNELIYGRPL